MYALIKGFGDSIQHAYEDIGVPRLEKGFKRIVVFGMGANYNAGLLLKELLRTKMQVDVEQVPQKKEQEVLYVFMSYSGNTKEVVRAFRGIRGNKHMLVVTSGGKLMEFAQKRKVPCIEVPPHLHSRFTFNECFFPLVKCLEVSGALKKHFIDVKKVSSTLYRFEGKIEKEAKQLAFLLKKRSFAFYATQFLWPVAYRFMSSLEEDVKMVCHSHRIPELFHNELEALPSKDFLPVLFIDTKDRRGYEGQIAFFKKQLKTFFYFGYEKVTRNERIFLAFLFAYFLAFYLSLIKKNKVFMGETPISNEIKRR